MGWRTTGLLPWKRSWGSGDGDSEQVIFLQYLRCYVTDEHPSAVEATLAIILLLHCE